MDTISPFHHCTISPSQVEIANVISIHSTISKPQGEIESVTSERRISLDMLSETINGFNELTIQSTINDSEEDDAESDPNSNPKVATYTTNGNSPQKLILNRLIPKIIPGAIHPMEQTITDNLVVIRETLDPRQTILSKETVTDAARSGACIFRTHRNVNRTDRGGTNTCDRNTAAAAARLISPVRICHSTTNSRIRNRNKYIINPMGPVSPQWIRNAEKLKTSIDVFLQKIEVLDPFSVN